MQLLRQSTGASILVGPVLDPSGASYASMAIGDFNITKNGTSAAMASAATATHSHNGNYIIALTTGNTDTIGQVAISCNKSTYAMSTFGFEVLAGAMFDALTGTTALALAGGDMNAAKIGGTVQTGRDLGASVLLSSGTGTGQVSLSAGAITVGTNNDKTGYALTQTFPSNFSSLGISAGGKINGVVLADTLTAYTGNTPQTGDAFARIGAAGAGLTALGDTRMANLDATVSSRSTFAGGAVASVTAAVTLPSIPANWLTSAGIAASALNGKGDWMPAYTQPAGFLGFNFGTVALASQIPAHFTNGTFVADGVFATAALANAPTSGGLDAAGVRTAIGMSTANLDTQLSAIKTEGDAIKAKTDNLPSSPAATGAAMTLTTAYDAAKTANATAPDNTSIAAIKAKTDNLPSDPAGQSATGTAITNATSPLALASTATAVKAVTDKLATMIEAVSSAWRWTEQALSQAPSGSGGNPLTLTKDDLLAFGPETLGYANAMLLPVIPQAPTIVIPAPPADSTKCAVYGYFENVGPATGAVITFTLKPTDKPVAGARLLLGRTVTASITAGTLMDSAGHGYLALERNDTTPGSHWLVECEEAGLSGVRMTLGSDTFDLGSLAR